MHYNGCVICQRCFNIIAITVLTNDNKRITKADKPVIIIIQLRIAIKMNSNSNLIQIQFLSINKNNLI